MTAPVLEILDVHMHFPIYNAWGRRTGWLRAVDGVSLTVARGEILGVVGESGCGKTTLGKTIVGIHSASAGEILFEGHEVGSLSPSAGRAMRRTLQYLLSGPWRITRSALEDRPRVGRASGDPHRTSRG